MKQRVREMEMEAEKLREMQAQVEKEMNESGGGQEGGHQMEEEKEAVDGRSVYVGNVCRLLIIALRRPTAIRYQVISELILALGLPLLGRLWEYG